VKELTRTRAFEVKELTVALAKTDSVKNRTIAENLTTDLNYEWARAQNGGSGV
jgi:hypothetical protein